MADELIGGEVEEFGVDVAGIVCEQEMVALLDEGEVVLFWSARLADRVTQQAITTQRRLLMADRVTKTITALTS